MKYALVTFAFFTFIDLSSQELDQDFINSLPESIKQDVLENINTGSSNVLQSQKDYDSFSTNFNKNDQNMADSEELFLKKFGDEFFKNTPSTFMPINDPASNSGYILDVDDEILIQLIGDRSDQYTYKIDRSGSIAIKDIGKINIAGLSIELANKAINKILSENFIETEAVLSLVRVRDIEVLITGHVNNPGIYVLSGYSNVLHALIMAGGISDNGSFRNVIIKRKNQKNTSIDLYDIFVYADTSYNLSLRSGDSIFVESTNNLVPVIGGVAREAIYEFKNDETTDDLINFAGGRTSNSFSQKVILSRFSNGELGSIKLNGPTRLLMNDKIFVPYDEFDPSKLSIDSKNNFISLPVNVSGAVINPGNYYIEPSERLSTLLKKIGGYKNNAYPLGGILTSKEAALLEKTYNEKLYNEAIKSLASLSNVSKSIDISSLTNILSEFKEIKASGRVVAEFDQQQLEKFPDKDTIINPGDSIHIPYQIDRVYIFGEVLNPGTLKYTDLKGLNDYIQKAGGLNKYAEKNSIIIVSPNGEVVRASMKKFGSSVNDISPGTVIYVPRDLAFIEGTELAKVIAPILSSLAISLASFNSISNN
tara:strand:+ start:652 stop:2430 length:1779 start_codon:yes stop_codon:yes gene_type:complete